MREMSIETPPSLEKHMQFNRKHNLASCVLLADRGTEPPFSACEITSSAFKRIAAKEELLTKRVTFSW
jgi:hypothetical protein